MGMIIEVANGMKISEDRGMLPIQDPIQQFSGNFQKYLEIAQQIPELLAQKNLIAAVNNLSTSAGSLEDFIADATPAEIERAYSVLATLCNAYIYEHRNSSNKDAPAVLPQNLAIGFDAVATKLGINPTQTYYSYVIQNWRRIDPTKDITIDNIDVLLTYTNKPDEKGFIKLHVVCEALAGKAILYAVKLQQLLRSKNDFVDTDVTLIINYLDKIAESVNMVTAILPELIKICDPQVFYTDLRQYVKPFEKGVIFTGVKDSKRIFRGPSGAQTCIFAILDRLMGIPVKTLDYMRPYMTEQSRVIIDSFDPDCLVNTFTTINRHEIETARVNVVTEIHGFRQRHLYLIFREYAMAFSNENVGTGSTYYKEFLGNNLERTKVSQCPFTTWYHRQEAAIDHELEDASLGTTTSTTSDTTASTSLSASHVTSSPVNINMSPEVAGKLAGVAVYGYRLNLTSKKVADFTQEIARIHAQWRGKTIEALNNEKLVKAYVAFNSSIGLDKKTIPSTLNLISRSLLPEVAKFPHIHPVVDHVNIAVVDSLIPLGVFDANCVKGELQLAYSNGGESFFPLGGKPENLKSNVLVLRDNEKVLSKFAVRDSDAQKITANTKVVWLLACQVPGVDKTQILAAMDIAINQLKLSYEVEISKNPIQHTQQTSSVSNAELSLFNK